MAKYNRENLTGDLAPVNAELEKVEQALEDKHDRKPEFQQANQLEDTMDANSNRIINVGQPKNANDAARLKDIQIVSGGSSLPDQEDNAGKVLKTDGTVASWQPLDPSDIGFSSITVMKATDSSPLEVVKTNGFYATGDGGGAEYEIVTPAQHGGPADEIVDHTLSNGNIAKLKVEGNTVKSSQIGCQDDGSNQAIRLTTALATLTGRARVMEMVKKTNPYVLSTKLEVPSRMELTGWSTDWIFDTVFESQVVGDFAILFRGSGSNLGINVTVDGGYGVHFLDTPSWFKDSWVKNSATNKSNTYGLAVGTPSDLTVATGACYYSKFENVRVRAFDTCVWIGPYGNQLIFDNVQCVTNVNDNFTSTYGIECYGRGNQWIGGGIESQFTNMIAFLPAPTAVPAQISVQNIIDGIWLEPETLPAPTQKIILGGNGNVIRNVRDGGVNYEIERPAESRYCEFISPKANADQAYLWQVSSGNLIEDAGFANATSPAQFWNGLGVKSIAGNSFRGSKALQVSNDGAQNIQLDYRITSAEDIAWLKGKDVSYSCWARSTVAGNTRISLIRRFGGSSFILWDSERFGTEYDLISTTSHIPEDTDELWLRIFRPYDEPSDNFIVLPTLTVGTQQSELAPKPLYDQGGNMFGITNWVAGTVRINNQEVFHPANFPTQLAVARRITLDGDFITQTKFFDGSADITFTPTLTRGQINVSSDTTFRGVVISGETDGAGGTTRAWLEAQTGGLRAQPSTGDLTSAGTITATAFVPFTGAHIFFSPTRIGTGLAVDLVDTKSRTFRVQDEIYKTNGEVKLSQAKSKVCAGVVAKCVKVSKGYIVYVAAVGDNRSGELKGFKIDKCKAGDILCTASGGKLQVAPEDIPREVVTFKAMSDSKNGVVYGYF